MRAAIAITVRAAWKRWRARREGSKPTEPIASGWRTNCRN